MKSNKVKCVTLLIALFVASGCATNSLYRELSKIPGGFSKVSVSANVPLYGGSNLTAINGRMVEGVFVIEHVIFDINTPFFDAHYVLEGMIPDYPVGRQINDPVESEAVRK